MCVTVMLIVFGALGRVPKALKKRLGKLENRERIETIRTSAMLKSLWIITRFHVTSGDLSSPRFLWLTPTSTPGFFWCFLLFCITLYFLECKFQSKFFQSKFSSNTLNVQKRIDTNEQMQTKKSKAKQRIIKEVLNENLQNSHLNLHHKIEFSILFLVIKKIWFIYDSPNLQHYQNLTIRLFNVISKTLVGGFILLCRKSTGVFCSPSRPCQNIIFFKKSSH